MAPRENPRIALNQSAERKALVEQRQAVVAEFGVLSPDIEHEINHIIGLADEVRLGRKTLVPAIEKAFKILRGTYQNETNILEKIDDLETSINRYILEI